MAQSQITLNEGKDYWNQHVMSGATVWAGLFRTTSVGGGGIIATSTLAGMTEATGTGYARQSVALGATQNGIMTIPQTIWNTGSAVNWPADCTGWFIASAATNGVALFVWDFLTVHNMSFANARLFITALDIFLMNVGEG